MLAISSTEPLRLFALSGVTFSRCWLNGANKPLAASRIRTGSAKQCHQAGNEIHLIELRIRSATAAQGFGQVKVPALVGKSQSCPAVA